MNDALSGLRVAIPESRELDLFSRMLEERGASTVRCPLVAIRDTPVSKPVEDWLDRFIAEPPHWLILLTGEGLNRLLGFAERRGRLKTFQEALGKTRTLTRGPKPGRALRSIGLRPNLLAETPTTAGVINTLATLNLKGRRVGVQLYGEEPNPALMQALDEAGAEADAVAPYVYASDMKDPEVLALIDALTNQAVDVIAFTSKSQINRLFSIAEYLGRRRELIKALQLIQVAAVGPVVAEALVEIGVTVALQPQESYFMKPLVRELELAVREGRIAPRG